MGLYEISIFLVTMYSLGVVLLIAVMRYFFVNSLMHELHWLLIVSYFCYWLAAVLMCVHWSRYLLDGTGNPGCEIFGRCFEVVGYLIFINSLLLIARGWTITTSKLSRKTENMFFTCVLVCIYVGLFFSDTLRDPADSTYLYDSWAGYLFIAMNLFLMITFLLLIRRTYIFEKRVIKRNFYRRFAFVYTLWFLQVPILVIISRSIPHYYRSKTLYGTERCFQLLAFMLIPMLQKPKNSFEVYSASDNYDARIPSVARQLRVQPMAIELPQSQVSGSLPGAPPPVNRNMTTNIEEANRRIVNLQQQLQQENISARNNDAPTTSRGEGIIES
mmetsp:Transcript_73168/g.107373  ORF Transcript_73168/g.107373 Transcript_73168/m.107373 type:complete len:330 (-) Transcript_73168:574-1563(-)